MGRREGLTNSVNRRCFEIVIGSANGTRSMCNVADVKLAMRFAPVCLIKWQGGRGGVVIARYGVNTLDVIKARD